MAVDRERLENARRNRAHRATIRNYFDGSYAAQLATTPHQSYESARNAARNWKGYEGYENSRGKFVKFNSKERNSLKSVGRQIIHNYSTRGNDYQYATREQVQAQHNSRYRNIRRAFGMSAG